MNWDELKNIITKIDWNEFHFIRPKALYLFVPLIVIVLLLIISNKERRRWKEIIAKHLRPYMFNKGSGWAIVLPILFFIIAVSSMIIGLAGPAWKKKEIPGQKIQAVVLIALDLSKSMMTKDIQPNRIERAKFKINDLLDANPRVKAGLIAFAGSANPVLPFTSDYKIIKFHAQSLSNRIMPLQGTNTPVLLQQVDTLMKHITAPSTLLLITDAIDNEEAALLSSWVNGSIHRLEILLVSTPNGGRIPGYSKVVSRQDPAVIENLAQNNKIIITPLTLDNSDVKAIAGRLSKKLYFESEKKKDAKEWDDMGYLMIYPALLITAFWFRKGWTVQWCILLLSTLALSSCGLKSKNPDWWYSKDYQGQMLENAGKYADAADRFEDDKRKAVAYFKAGNYSAAADLFSLDSTAAGTYNMGLALAKQGRYDAAEDAFNKAISLDSTLKGTVSKSLAATKATKHQADSIAQLSKTSVSKTTHDKQIASKKKHKDDPLKEHKPQSDDEQLSADTRVKNLPKFGNRTTDKTASNIHIGKEAKKPGKTPPQKNQSGQLASNILLRKVEADPSEFLHKRFLLQEKLYYKKTAKSKTPW
jgi:Ca-activated chloride channel family protein